MTPRDAVALEINAEHLYLAPFSLGEIVIYRKAEITFPTAKIVYRQRALTRKLRVYIFNYFKETVYLSELTLTLVVDASRLVAYAELDEELLVARKQIVFLIVESFNARLEAYFFTRQLVFARFDVSF